MGLTKTKQNHHQRTKNSNVLHVERIESANFENVITNKKTQDGRHRKNVQKEPKKKNTQSNIHKV